jgi:hypothetical protein
MEIQEKLINEVSKHDTFNINIEVNSKKLIEVIKRQHKKGVEKYGHTIDNCPKNKFDWDQMALEELADYLTYLLKNDSNFFKSKVKERPSIFLINKAITTYFKIKEDALRNKTRFHDIVYYRSVYYYIGLHFNHKPSLLTSFLQKERTMYYYYVNNLIPEFKKRILVDAKNIIELL